LWNFSVGNDFKLLVFIAAAIILIWNFLQRNKYFNKKRIFLSPNILDPMERGGTYRFSGDFLGRCSNKALNMKSLPKKFRIVFLSEDLFHNEINVSKNCILHFSIEISNDLLSSTRPI